MELRQSIKPSCSMQVSYFIFSNHMNTTKQKTKLKIERKIGLAKFVLGHGLTTGWTVLKYIDLFRDKSLILINNNFMLIKYLYSSSAGAVRNENVFMIYRLLSSVVFYLGYMYHRALGNMHWQRYQFARII